MNPLTPVTFKSVLKAWLITAAIASILNLAWFYVCTFKSGNPWSALLFEVPILVMCFATIAIGSLVYWALTFKLKKADLIFAIGALALTTLSVMGNPTLPDGTIVPKEFRLMDIPMHFVAGLLCAFLVPAICRGKMFTKKK